MDAIRIIVTQTPEGVMVKADGTYPYGENPLLDSLSQEIVALVDSRLKESEQYNQGFVLDGNKEAIKDSIYGESAPIEI